MVNHAGGGAAPVPETLERPAGNWLALSPIGGRYGIGVIGETREEAIRRFWEASGRWDALLDSKPETQERGEP
jgi:hypothetical protein